MQAKILRENWRASGKKQFERMCAFNLAQLIGLAENHGHPKLLKEFSGSYLSITLSLKSMFLLQSASRFKLDQPKNNAQSKREKRGVEVRSNLEEHPVLCRMEIFNSTYMRSRLSP